MNKKKIIALVGAACLAIGLAACGNGTTQADGQTGATEKKQAVASVDANAGASIEGPASGKNEGQHTDSHVAVIYFSEPEGSDMNALQGSTQYIGQVIADKTGADVFRIMPDEAYPTDHKALGAKAKLALMREVRPAIQDTVGNLSQDDTIVLGYPIWWGDLPMPVYTFLDSHHFDGKKIIPFSTHGGSGLAGTVAKVAQVAQAEPGADVENNAYTVSRDDVVQAKDSVLSWLAQLGY